MKLKNLNNRTKQDLQDIFYQVQSFLQVGHMEYTTIKVINYQIQEDDSQDGVYYYEVYESDVMIELETEIQEFTFDVIKKEKVVKEYKTAKGLLQAFLNGKDITGNQYRTLTVI